jgi:hypothetical protein
LRNTRADLIEDNRPEGPTQFEPHMPVSPAPTYHTPLLRSVSPDSEYEVWPLCTEGLSRMVHHAARSAGAFHEGNSCISQADSNSISFMPDASGSTLTTPKELRNLRSIATEFGKMSDSRELAMSAATTGEHCHWTVPTKTSVKERDARSATETNRNPPKYNPQWAEQS